MGLRRVRARPPAPARPSARPDAAPVAAHGPQTAPMPAVPVLDRARPAYGPVLGPVTAALDARMLPADFPALEAVLEGAAKQLWDEATPQSRRVLAPLLAVYYALDGVTERTGLIRATPPDSIHAMARGPLACAGDTMLGDLVMRAFDEAALPFASHATVLDFGCSSGRVIRAIAAVRSDLDLLGCDPNADAIAWANAHLPGIRFLQSAVAPPLPLVTASVDRVYAISIWSHFAAGPALAWLDEMHRVVTPGGALMLTTHGLDTLAHQLRENLMSRDAAADATAALVRDGHHFLPVFGDAGDWGVTDPGWGEAYAGADWVAEHVTPRWSIRLFRPAMLQCNQDVFVLERRP